RPVGWRVRRHGVERIRPPGPGDPGSQALQRGAYTPAGDANVQVPDAEGGDRGRGADRLRRRGPGEAAVDDFDRAGGAEAHRVRRGPRRASQNTASSLMREPKSPGSGEVAVFWVALGPNETNGKRRNSGSGRTRITKRGMPCKTMEEGSGRT